MLVTMTTGLSRPRLFFAHGRTGQAGLHHGEGGVCARARARAASACAAALLDDAGAGAKSLIPRVNAARAPFCVRARWCKCVVFPLQSARTKLLRRSGGAAASRRRKKGGCSRARAIVRSTLEVTQTAKLGWLRSGSKARDTGASETLASGRTHTLDADEMRHARAVKAT